MSSLVLTLTETLRYRGAIGQWSWALHRLSGLGVVVFLVMHVIDTSWAVFYPALYEEAIAVYQTPLFTIGEFILIACVVYHAYNGLRIVVLDARPRLWRYQEKAAVWVIIATLVTLIPVFLLMFGHVINYYNDDPKLLGIGDVINAVLPFVLGALAAIVAAIVFSAIAGSIAGDNSSSQTKSGSGAERFWWSFMRLSGVIIFPLVFGHLAAMHVLQGVFDISLQNGSIVGTEAINASGTAVEFVGERWEHLVAGIAIWRITDVLLLTFAVIHGANGLRYVLTDYTYHNPLLRRAVVYLCIIGTVIMLAMGSGALIGTIESTAIEMAEEARQEMGIGIRSHDEDDEQDANDAEVEDQSEESETSDSE